MYIAKQNQKNSYCTKNKIFFLHSTTNSCTKEYTALNFGFFRTFFFILLKKYQQNIPVQKPSKYKIYPDKNKLKTR